MERFWARFQTELTATSGDSDGEGRIFVVVVGVLEDGARMGSRPRLAGSPVVQGNGPCLVRLR